MAEASLPYIYTDWEGWVMELLAGHPQCICTELGVSHEIFIALIDELHHIGCTNSKFVSLEEQLAICSMQVSQVWLFST